MCGIAGIVCSIASRCRAAARGTRADDHTPAPPRPRRFWIPRGRAGGLLAHARLSIIDVAGGGQPIHNEDRSVWVVFNGEIVNYVELRAELERHGHVFYTRSDTEVIVHLYEQRRIDFVHHLNGQFAIALSECRRQRLVLARDRTGIRPVFYTVHDGRLVFASEIKALFGARGVPRRLLPMALGQVFTYWSAQAPTTIFRRRALPAFRAHPGARRRHHARPQILGLGLSAIATLWRDPSRTWRANCASC